METAILTAFDLLSTSKTVMSKVLLLTEQLADEQVLEFIFNVKLISAFAHKNDLVVIYSVLLNKEARSHCSRRVIGS